MPVDFSLPVNSAVENWMQRKNQNNQRIFWGNRETKESTYQEPPCWTAAMNDSSAWEEKTSEKHNGKIYYVNRKTRQTSWVKPPCLAEEGEGSDSEDDDGAEKTAEKTETVAVTAGDDPENNPDNWKQLTDQKTGRMCVFPHLFHAHVHLEH
jgi:hypothetical protein